MPDNIKIQIGKKSLDSINKRLKDIKKHTTDNPSFWKVVTIYLFQIIIKTFKLLGARDGHSAWKKFSENTLFYQPVSEKKYRFRRGKVKYNASSKLLQSSGQLRNSFRTLASGKMFVKFGTRLNYASKHQLGDPQTNLPAREMLFLTRNDEINIVKKWSFFKGFKRA